MTVTRRNFLATTAGVAGYWTIAGSTRAAFRPEEDLRVAVIGFRSRGNKLIGDLKHRVVALCDVDQKVLDDGAGKLQEKLGQSIDRFTDYRRLLERQDIDAVAIATPNHTHALITIAAAQAGKHVYVEKPVSHNVWEGRQMVAAAKQYGRMIQCGTQSRSSSALKEAVDYVRNGQLGKILYAIGTCYKPRKSIGKLDQPLSIPSHLDYDLWCGPAENRDLYRPQLHYDWHWDYNTGNGDMGNQGIHQMDIARWFLGEDKLPPRVLSIGGRLGYVDAADTPNTQITFLDYPSAPLIFETRGLPRSKSGQRNWGDMMDRYRGCGVGVVVQCEKGHVLIPNYHEAIVFDLSGKQLKKWDKGGDHMGNWVSAALAGDRSQLNADILEGHLSSAMCHLGGISHRTGETLIADAIAERVKSNRLLAGAFDRMASHLRANDVEIDREPVITFGSHLEVVPSTGAISNNDGASELLSRKQRAPHIVPELERLS